MLFSMYNVHALFHNAWEDGPYVIKLEQKPSILYQYYLSLEACETQEIITKNEYLEIFAFRYSIFFINNMQ